MKKGKCRNTPRNFPEKRFGIEVMAIQQTSETK